MYDISNFMTWWINQVINIFTYSYNLLDSITFGGTSILRIIIMTAILSALVSVVLVVPNRLGKVLSERRPKERTKQNDN